MVCRLIENKKKLGRLRPCFRGVTFVDRRLEMPYLCKWHSSRPGIRNSSSSGTERIGIGRESGGRVMLYSNVYFADGGEMNHSLITHLPWLADLWQGLQLCTRDLKTLCRNFKPQRLSVYEPCAQVTSRSTAMIRDGGTNS